MALNCEERQREACIAGSVRRRGLKEEALRAHLDHPCREKTPGPELKSVPGLSSPLAL